MSTPSRPDAHPTLEARRRAVLFVVPFGFVLMTLNWFAIAPTFGQLSQEFGVEIPKLALLIAGFVAGYGIFHVPAGFLATRLGLRATLVIGLALEGITAALSGLADGYWVLMVLRVLCGVGASIYAGVGIAAVSVWFAGRSHALALGVVSATFSLGASLGLYVWGGLVAAMGWRASLIVGGAACVLTGLLVGAVYRVPPGSAALSGVRITTDAIKQTLGNRLLWTYGLAFLGAYGAYFAASQLVEIYAVGERQFTPGQAGIAALFIGLAGIPGSIVAGWLSDRLNRRRTLVLWLITLEAIGLITIPLAGASWFWLPAVIVGFAFNGCFAVWQTIPGEDESVSPENIGTAVGLMLTITAVGGFVIPWVFGAIVPAAGYPLAWVFLAAASLLSGLVALRAREPRSRVASPEGITAQLNVRTTPGL